MTADEAGRLDPDLVARWIAIAALLASAQDLQARGGGAWPALALIAADTANETILGTIAVAGGKYPARDASFEDTYNLALAALDELEHTMPQGLRTRVVTVHRHRNAAVHAGVEPAPKVIRRALETAADLRSLAVDALELMESFRTAGPVTAVAKVVGIEPIASALIGAEQHLEADRLERAADQCAIALDAALERVKPGLRSDTAATGAI